MKSGLQAFSFNGEPQAQAKPGNDACGLPLNDQNDSHRAGLCQPPDFRQTQHQGTHVPPLAETTPEAHDLMEFARGLKSIGVVLCSL